MTTPVSDAEWLWQPACASSEALREQVHTLAPFNHPLLVVGERGTGKSHLAREIHRIWSPGKRFVHGSAPAISETLEHDILYGHVKGAFTGADYDRIGLVEQASGGILFLDEIGLARPSLQQQLLTLMDGTVTFRRLGDVREITVQMRLIAATNEDLMAAVSESRFRQDLLDRFGWFVIEIPPLRQRRAEILPLAEAFFVQAGALLGRPPVRLTAEARALFRNGSWPGNLRHLREACKLLTCLAARRASDAPLRLQDLPAGICERSTPLARPARGPVTPQMVLAALDLHGGNVSRAAASIRCDRRQVQRILKKSRMEATLRLNE